VTTATTPLPGGAPMPVPASRSRLAWAWADGLAVTWRNLLGYVRIPQQLFFSSVQPIMFVLLFRYAFGGAIQLPVPNLDYVDFLIPGIFVQVVIFGVVATAVGLADDMTKGLVERFRSLPMARSAVLVGRTTADLCRNVFVVALMTGVGYLVGFRVQTDLLGYFAGVAIVLLFGYSLLWGSAIIGLASPNSETAQLMIFPAVFPLVFASSAFVPVQTMPGWLQAFANNQPVTHVVNATRGLIADAPPALIGGSTTEAVLKALAWSVGLLAVLAPLAVRRYRQVA
jgi:ABC transporter DrrB family efflux protein